MSSEIWHRELERLVGKLLEGLKPILSYMQIVQFSITLYTFEGFSERYRVCSGKAYNLMALKRTDTLSLMGWVGGGGTGKANVKLFLTPF